MNLVHVTARPEPAHIKVSKVGGGYVFRAGAGYRCSECIQFIGDKGRCMLFGKDDGVSANGYCTMWAQGPRPSADDDDWDDVPQGCYRPSEVGYGEKKNGTLCKRCVHFDGKSRCEIVDGSINPGGCCNSQTPSAA